MLDSYAAHRLSRLEHRLFHIDHPQDRATVIAGIQILRMVISNNQPHCQTCLQDCFKCGNIKSS